MSTRNRLHLVPIKKYINELILNNQKEVALELLHQKDLRGFTVQSKWSNSNHSIATLVSAELAGCNQVQQTSKQRAWTNFRQKILLHIDPNLKSIEEDSVLELIENSGMFQ